MFGNMSRLAIETRVLMDVALTILRSVARRRLSAGDLIVSPSCSVHVLCCRRHHCRRHRCRQRAAAPFCAARDDRRGRRDTTRRDATIARARGRAPIIAHHRVCLRCESVMSGPTFELASERVARVQRAARRSCLVLSPPRRPTPVATQIAATHPKPLHQSVTVCRQPASR